MKYVDYTNINNTIKLPVNVTSVLETVQLHEAAKMIANYSDELKDLTNITKIWNETGISNLTQYVQWEALQTWLDSYGLGTLFNVTKI